MKQVQSAFIAMTCLFALWMDHAGAQGPGTVSVGITNRSDFNVIVLGSNGKKGGTPLQIKKNGGKAFDTNVPAGARYYTIHDANNPMIILGRFQGQINRDASFDIVPMPGNPKVLILTPSP